MAVHADLLPSQREFSRLLDVLPLPIRQALCRLDDLDRLVEIVLDLGRPPEARFPDDFLFLSERVVTAEDIAQVVSRVSEFGGDNRAGIGGTLHRISGIRNRRGAIVGLTCRVGRAVYGTLDIVLDVVRSGKSICLLGPPGVGKTTMLREAARLLSEDRKRVIVVDTSNEIAGDGDVPHLGIGHARRMQVPDPAQQHAVMIEAVENHMPQVVVIDEIGTVEEAQASRTIAERGVQLIATAHGQTLENILMNPTLSDLVGGIASVTLSDDEARRRGTRKTVLERKAPPAFDVLIEISGRDALAIHHNVAGAVDAFLRGFPVQPETRERKADGSVKVVKEATAVREGLGAEEGDEQEAPVAIFPYGVSRNKIERAVRNLRVAAKIARRWDDADLVITLKSLERRESEKLHASAADNVPIYAIKTNTTSQIQHVLKDIFDLPSSESEETALQEAGEAIYQVLLDNTSVELRPQSSYLRRLQHQLAEEHRVQSRSTGVEPHRRVQIFRGPDRPADSRRHGD